jgi:hypothetical protein
MAVQAVCCLGLAGVALRAHGTAIIGVLGAAYAAAMAIAAAQLILRVRRRLGPATHRITPSLLKITLGAALMAVPAALVSRGVGRLLPHPLGSMTAVLAAVIAGAVAFVATQISLRTREVDALTGGLAQVITRRGADDV